MMDPIIKIKNLDVIYNLGKTNEVSALKNINIEIYPEEYVIFFGPSGCGKSTLLYVIAGLEFMTRGEISVDGKNISTLSTKKLIDFYLSSIGIIFQSFYLISDLSAKDNILLSQFFAGVSVIKRKKRVEELIQRFDLSGFVNRKPSMLSGGQQQRIAIARALINDPLIILADEPVGNLDSKNAEIVMKLLGEFNEKDKKTVILVTHDPNYLHYANRVFYMRDGEIIKEVRNPEKVTIAPLVAKKEKVILPSEIEALSQRYPSLSETALKAKLLSQHLLTKHGEEEIGRLESAIESFLLGRINKKELIDILDLPYEKGGVGFYRQTAQRFVTEIQTVLFEAESLEEKIEDTLEGDSVLRLKVQNLRRYLLDNYEGQLNKSEELFRLERFIKMRLEKKINAVQFQKYLDVPLLKGGVGLNKRTAKNFTKRLEMILIKY